MCNITIFDTSKNAFCKFENIERIIIHYAGFGISEDTEEILSTDAEMLSHEYTANLSGQYKFFSSSTSSAIDGSLVGMIVVKKQ